MWRSFHEEEKWRSYIDFKSCSRFRNNLMVRLFFRLRCTVANNLTVSQLPLKRVFFPLVTRHACSVEIYQLTLDVEILILSKVW